METVFSHVVRKRFSHVNEDIATDALAYILQSSDAARRGLMKLLRGLVGDLPDLHFRAQESGEQICPDLWGFDGHDPVVFIENKFWAGLTEGQPVAYLQRLAEEEVPTVLLVVGPGARVEMLWREVCRRSMEAEVVLSESTSPAGVVHTANTGTGPVLAVTSWTHLLATLEREAAADIDAKSDLIQLRALCHAADADAFIPVSGEELTDHRTPSLILQLGRIVNDVVQRSVTDGRARVASQIWCKSSPSVAPTVVKQRRSERPPPGGGPGPPPVPSAGA